MRQELRQKFKRITNNITEIEGGRTIYFKWLIQADRSLLCLGVNTLISMHQENNERQIGESLTNFATLHGTVVEWFSLVSFSSLSTYIRKSKFEPPQEGIYIANLIWPLFVNFKF